MKEQFVIMYHGGITSGRGIEQLIRLLAININVDGIILGNGEENYIQSLKRLSEDLSVQNRLIIHEAVPIEVLWKYVGAVDLSLMMIQPSAKSYYYALPNKFFESVQALTPIVASDFPEMKRLIDKYEIGLTCDPTDIDAINSCVERMRTDKTFYTRCKENLKVAKQDLCWENEKEVLKAAYAKVMTR